MGRDNCIRLLWVPPTDPFWSPEIFRVDLLGSTMESPEFSVIKHLTVAVRIKSHLLHRSKKRVKFPLLLLGIVLDIGLETLLITEQSRSDRARNAWHDKALDLPGQ